MFMDMYVLGCPSRTRRRGRYMYIDMYIDMCLDVCIDMRIDMRMGMCVDVRLDKCTDMCIGMRSDMRIDMCVDLCFDMGLGMRMDTLDARVEHAVAADALVGAATEPALVVDVGAVPIQLWLI